MDADHRQIRQGFFLVLGGAFCLSLMAFGVRRLSPRFPSETLVFYRALIQSLLLLPWWGGYFGDRTASTLKSKFKLHFWRGGCGVLSMFFLYRALEYLPLALVTLLVMTSVPWGGVFSWFILKERPNRRQLFFGSITIVGVGLSLLHPGGRSWEFHPPGVFFALGCGAMTGLASTLMRLMGRTHGAGEIVFYFGLFGLAASSPFFIAEPRLPENLGEFSFLILIGFFGWAAQLLLSRGFKLAPTIVGQLAMIEQVPLSLVLGWLLLGEEPPSTFWIALSFVLVGVLGLLRRKKIPVV